MTLFRNGEGTRYVPRGHAEGVVALKMFNPDTGCSGYDIHITRFAPGSGMDEEVHPNSDHVFHVLEGSLEVLKGGRCVYVLEAGDTLRVPAGEYHQVQNSGSTDGVFFALTVPPIKE